MGWVGREAITYKGAHSGEIRGHTFISHKFLSYLTN